MRGILSLTTLALLLALASPQYAYAGIFDGVTSSNLYQNIVDQVQTVFQGRQFELGGSRLETGTGETTNNFRALIPSDLPPYPDTGDFIKMTLTWDTLFMGGQPARTIPDDPLGPEHLEALECCPGCTAEVVDAEHVLWGWCGETAQESGLPRGEIQLCQPGQTTDCVDQNSPGPNDNSFGNAIPNKLIRRDGYLYRCVSNACEVSPDQFESASRWSYKEFQTQIFHSNDFVMYLEVENPTNKQIDNININWHAASPLDEYKYPLPQNVDYPVERVSTTTGFEQFEHWNFQHGSTMDPSFSIIPTFSLGPYETKKFPIHPPGSERDSLPLIYTEDFAQLQSGAVAPDVILPPVVLSADIPCECQNVVTHECGFDCGVAAQNPNIGTCATYYGLDCTADDGGQLTCNGGAENNAFDNACSIITTDAAGVPQCMRCLDTDSTGDICYDQNIQVPGCPPPSYFNVVGEISDAERNPFYETIKQLAGTQDVYAEGCDVGCLNPPPQNPFLSLGAMVPRDYNFVCDPEDPFEQDGRCAGTATVQPEDPRFLEFRDVTDFGGCGYEASSNNSIIGPMEFVATFGQDSTSRSILLASIPVGGQILDDESRPIGWPVTGVITENWGNTGQAQEQGSYRSISDGSRNEYDEYLSCPGDGFTYPADGRPRAGDWLHPGIDIEPISTSISPLHVYTTHGGWVTFAGYDPAYPDKGYQVQLETDITHDNQADIITRYTHLLPGSLRFDVQNQRPEWLFTADNTSYTLGDGVYLPRNTLIGMMGDSGSEGVTQMQYEILTNATNQLVPLPTDGNLGGERCIDDPYRIACLLEPLGALFFSINRFEPQLVKGPVYVNP